MTDLFMKKKMTQYIENFAYFRETFMRLTGIEDYEQIYEQYLNFETEICSCETCREDECDVPFDVDTPDDDTLPDWD